MGKYIKKSKISGDVAVMEVSQPVSFRTRAAKTLALQRLRSHSAAADASVSSYLQLRSRRLEKPRRLTEMRKEQQGKQFRGDGGANPRSKSGPVKSSSVVAAPIRRSWKDEGCGGSTEERPVAGGDYGMVGFCDVDMEASLGENTLDFDITDRSTRESTPCNLIRTSETVATPGSTSRRISSATPCGRSHGTAQRIAPSAHEIEEFFAYAEQQQQRIFIEKYNFDIVDDLPLPGRYDWVQVVP